jgi:hypothetical protein
MTLFDHYKTISPTENAFLSLPDYQPCIAFGLQEVIFRIDTMYHESFRNVDEGHKLLAKFYCYA